MRTQHGRTVHIRVMHSYMSVYFLAEKKRYTERAMVLKITCICMCDVRHGTKFPKRRICVEIRMCVRLCAWCALSCRCRIYSCMHQVSLATFYTEIRVGGGMMVLLACLFALCIKHCSGPATSTPAHAHTPTFVFF